MMSRAGKQKSLFCLIFVALFLLQHFMVASEDALPMLSLEDETEIPAISLKDDHEIPSISLDDESQIPEVSLEDEREIPVLSLNSYKEEEKPVLKSEVKKKKKQILSPVKKVVVEPKARRISSEVKKKQDAVKREEVVKKVQRPEKKSELVVQQPRSHLVVKEASEKVSGSMLDLTKTEAGSLKIKKDRLVHKEKKESPLILSTAWKEMMQEDFHKKTKYISEIVNQGEEDPQEKEDFIDRFKKNKEWVSASLVATTTVVDPYFDALMQRKERIDLLVKTQKQADLLIHKMTLVKQVPEAVQSKLRLAVLYALNDLISSTNQVPSLRKIQALVEEKALIYGTLKDKEYQEATSQNILNAELAHEIKKLKKRLAAESKKHEEEYNAIKKELEEKERLAEEIRIKNEQAIQDLDVKNITLKMQEEKIKDAELKTSLMQQVQKETEFNAQRDMEATNKRSIQLEIALSEAEKERFAAEKMLRKALSDYKEVKEFVALLQKQADELATDNHTLLLNLERTVQEKSTLALEKQHAQRQLDRFKKEIAQLQERLVDQKKQMDRLQVTLEKAGHDKKYVLSQVTTMKTMQKRQKETEEKLASRVALLHQRLDDSSKKNLELAQLITALKEEYQLTLTQIQSIESLRNESLENSTLLRKEISRLLKEQTRQKVRAEELASLLEKGHMPRKEKKGLKKELSLLKKDQEQTGVELGVIQDLYETEQLQQENLSTILQEMKAQIFDQEGQLEELEKRSTEKSLVLLPTKDDLIEDEDKITALKRKNRALKNKINALERLMQSKSASKEDEYFAKDHTKVAPAPEVEEVEVPEKQIEEGVKTAEKAKKELKAAKKEVAKKEVVQKEKELQSAIEQEEKEQVKKEAPQKSARSMEKIVGSFEQPKKTAQVKKPVVPSPTPSKPVVQQRVMPKVPVISETSETSQPIISSPVNSSTPQLQEKSQPGINSAANKDEGPVGMKEITDAIQKGIQEDPEAFRETMLQAAANITEDDVIEATKHIEAMSDEERGEFTAFIGSMIEAMPPDLLPAEMFPPKK